MSFSIKTKVCEVLQLETKTNNVDYAFGFKLFKLYEKRIIQAPKSVRVIFTTDNIASAFANFRYINDNILNYAKKTESLKLPFYKTLADPCFLLIISSNIQNTKVDRIYHSFCDNITLVDLISLGSDLLHKKYFPKSTKRIFIPVICGKMRLLGIVSLLDKIVQRALTIVVAPRLELVFSDFSYGFKPYCNHHSALTYIYNHWRSVHWFLECNLVQCFGVCNYSILLSTFTRYVDDYWTSVLINRIMRQGYIYFWNLCESLFEFDVIMSQRSMLSSLLCNIFFHELDIQLEKYCNNCFTACFKQGGVNQRILTTSNYYTNSFKKPSKWLSKGVRSNKTCISFKHIRELHKAGHNLTESLDLNAKKIEYIRHFDHFILAIAGNKKFACEVLTRVSIFLDSLGLKLDIKKSGVNHYEKGVLFLGYNIIGKYPTEVLWKQWKFIDRPLSLEIPVQKFFQRFVKQGFFQRIKSRKSFKFVGRKQNKWLFLSNAYEIIYRFNGIIRCVRSYYLSATQKSILNKFCQIMQRSAALTLAHKFKKNNVSWAIHKFGNKLTVINPTNGKRINLCRSLTDLFQYEDFSYLSSILQGVPIPITLNASCFVRELNCAIPNCTLAGNRWYYIKHRKRFKGFEYKKPFSSYFAKQIPLCESHYKLIYTGIYNGPSLRKLPGYIPSFFE